MDEKDLEAFETLVNAVEKERAPNDLSAFRAGHVNNRVAQARKLLDKIRDDANASNEQASTDHGTGTTQE